MAPGYLQAAAAPHTSQSFQVREEHALTVLKCSALRQEIPVTAAHVPDPYFITVNSHYAAGSHTRSDSPWRNLQSRKTLVYSGPWNTQINQLMESKVTLAKIKEMFFNRLAAFVAAAAGDTPPPAGGFG